MNRYELNFIIPSPGDSVTLAEFSPNGQFLAVGDQDLTSLYILDKLTGFHPKVSAITLGQPTALVWETDETFYVGLNDGYFIHYRINFKRDILVEGAMNGYLRREGFPITSMALDAGSTTLVVSVGPAVFAFRRIRATSQFRFVANISTHFGFRKDPGTPAFPFPRSLSFTPNNVLIITFCRQYIVSIVLEFDKNSQLRSSLKMAKIDYSGQLLLKAITSATEQEIHQLTRLWVHGTASETGGGSFPFLFINRGSATVSGSALGVAVIRDTVTHRKIQLLEHTAIIGRTISAIAYHVSNDTYSITTADRGTNATIKIWTARKLSCSQIQHGFVMKRRWVVATIVVAFIAAVMFKTGGLSDVNEILQLWVGGLLACANVCTRIGFLVLDAAGDADLDAGDALD